MVRIVNRLVFTAGCYCFNTFPLFGCTRDYYLLSFCCESTAVGLSKSGILIPFVISELFANPLLKEKRALNVRISEG